MVKSDKIGFKDLTFPCKLGVAGGYLCATYALVVVVAVAINIFTGG